MTRLVLEAAKGAIAVDAVCDVSPGSIETARQVLGSDFRAFESLEDLLRASDAPWVLIGSPNAFHVDAICASLAAGRNVFCEKPLATTVADCHRAEAAVRAHPERMFFFGLVLRYSPFYRRVQEIVASGEIGKLVSFEFNETLGYYHGSYIHGNWRRHRRLAGTHVLEKCCHDLDLANWIVGSTPVRAASFGGLDVFRSENKDIGDSWGTLEDGRPAWRLWPDPDGIHPFNDDKDIVDNQVAILEYANGVRASFHTNCISGIPERRFVICGTKGSLRADAVTSLIEVCASAPHATLRKEDLGCGGGHAGADPVMAEHLARSILHGDPPAAGIQEAVASSMAAVLIDQAADTGQVATAP